MFVNGICLFVLSVMIVCSCQSNKGREKQNEPQASEKKKRSRVQTAEADIAESDEIDLEFWLSRAELEKEFKEAVEEAKKDKENPRKFVDIAELAFLLNKVTVGRQACKRSLKLNPGFPTGLLACAKIEFADENYDLAELTLDKLSKKNQAKAVVIELRAMIALKRGKLNDASELYQKAVLASPNNLKLRLNAGLLLLKYRQVDAAKAQFLEVIKRNEDNSIAQFHLGIIAISENKVDEAKKYFTEVLNDDVLGDYAKYHYAKALEHEGKFVESAEALTKISSNHPREELNLAVTRLSTRVNTMRGLEKELEVKEKERKTYARYLEEKKKLDELRNKTKADAKKGAK